MTDAEFHEMMDMEIDREEQRRHLEEIIQFQQEQMRERERFLQQQAMMQQQVQMAESIFSSEDAEQIKKQLHKILWENEQKNKEHFDKELFEI